MIARNERRVEGRAPLDVEAEIERQLGDFDWPARPDAQSWICKLACACRDSA